MMIKVGKLPNAQCTYLLSIRVVVIFNIVVSEYGIYAHAGILEGIKPFLAALKIPFSSINQN